jgi:hypothetical protein
VVGSTIAKISAASRNALEYFPEPCILIHTPKAIALALGQSILAVRACIESTIRTAIGG